MYYKILNEKGIHYNYQYVDGLNVLQETFDDDPTHSCCPGGFYFTTLEHIHNFYNYDC